jgi:predicted P-loop ATPase/GTPase
MEELPIVLPNRSLSYSILFDSLTSLYSEQEEHHSQTRTLLESLSDALVYSLYFQDTDNLEKLVDDRISVMRYETRSPEKLCEVIDDTEISKAIDEILESPIVKEIELLGNFPPQKKSLRY